MEHKSTTDHQSMPLALSHEVAAVFLELDCAVVDVA